MYVCMYVCMYVPPHCAVLVWNREWFLRELGECMNVFIDSIPNAEQAKKETEI